MEIIYNIVIPIVTSILGGLIGGLFTFLGVKMTIKNDNKLKKQELKLRNQEKNKEIISNKPEFIVIDNQGTINKELEIYVLPYTAPKLKSKEEIIFDYDEFDFNDDSWACKETLICNNGKKTIETSFLQLKYKSDANIYSKHEFFSWGKNMFAKNYYSDVQSLPRFIRPNDSVKLKIYYPKNKQYLQNIQLGCYMHDESDNYWYQDGINIKSTHNNSTPICHDEYNMHYREEYYKWFVFDSLYYNDSVEKCFNTFLIEKTLKQRKEKLWKKDRDYEKFKTDIKNGDKLLNS